jgi:hypothetical protein
MFPRSVIDVHVQIFESDGGTRTAAAIAASAALADAGIPMRDLTGGIATGLYEDMVCLDLDGLEDNVGSGDMPILYSPNIDEVSLFQLDGLFTFEQFKQSFNYSLNAVKDIVDVIKSALKQKYVLVRDELALEEDEEEVETQYSSEEEDLATTPPEVTSEDETYDEMTVEAESVVSEVEQTSVIEPEQTKAEEVEITDTNVETPEPTTTVGSEPEMSSVEIESKSVSEMLAEEADSTGVQLQEENDQDHPDFDRSTLKPMGGIIQKIATSEEENSDSSEESEDNLKDLYKKIKSDDDDENSSNDIMRDIEYSDLEEDN